MLNFPKSRLLENPGNPVKRGFYGLTYDFLGEEKGGGNKKSGCILKEEVV